MTRTRVLVVDDEAAARERLGRHLSARNASFEIDYAANGFEALEKIKRHPPEILFLDVQMPGMSGFDVLKNLEERPFQVIFQTAYEEYALKAFEESACDYLLKPFDPGRLDKAVERAALLSKTPRPSAATDNALRTAAPVLEKIAIKQGNKAFQLDANDVVCFTSKDHYTCVYTSDKDYIIDLSLNYLEANLDASRFFRCHRSHIVALSHVSSLELGARMKAICKNGHTVEVSRHNRAAMKRLLDL